MVNDLSNSFNCLSRNQRFLKELQSDHFSVDERDQNDLMKFMAEFAESVSFYNTDNNTDGNWKPFFYADPEVISVLILKFDVIKAISDFEKTKKTIEDTNSDARNIAIVKELIRYILNLVDRLEGILEHFRASGKKLTGKNSDKLFDEDPDEFFHDILVVYKRVKAVFPSFGILEEAEKKIREKEKKGIITEIGDNDNAPLEVTETVTLLENIFNGLRATYSRLTGAAKYYIRHRQRSDHRYPPHLALMKGFLNVYGQLQSQLNGFTGRHLDYYYRDILKFRPHEGRPDKINLVATCTSAQVVNVPAGEELLIEQHGKPDEIFIVENAVQLHPVAIKQLRTIYTAHDPFYREAAKDTTAAITAYEASHAVYDPETYNALHATAWPLFGEDQSEYSEGMATMKKLTAGLLVSSPLYYLKDGTRHITTRFYLSEAAYNDFLEIKSAFSGNKNDNTDNAAFYILSKAFTLRLTIADGWLDITDHSTRLLTEGDSSFLEISFVLDAFAPSTAPYDATVHGGNDVTGYPCLQLLVNQDNSYNPLVFFSTAVVTRISIDCKVRNASNFFVLTNYGPVNTALQFAPFGVMPVAGSYMYVANPAIFNKHTRSACVRYNWFDLPKAAGGFEKYYEAYHNGTRNESYKIKISKDDDARQGNNDGWPQYDLFTTIDNEQGSPVLSNTSEIEFRLTGKLQLQNKMEVCDAILTSPEELQASKGKIMIELAQPQDPFGHKLYPQLLPEILLHNSRRFVRKKDLPNPPFTLLASNMTVDYELYHSEVTALRPGKEKESAISIVHLYPFGEEKVYPGSVTQLTLVPAIPRGGHLLMGLSGIKPGIELSLLFQLSESTHEERSFNPAPVNWQYLYDNRWISLPKSAIIADTTNHLISSGLVTLRMPVDISARNTVLSPDLFWIKATVAEEDKCKRPNVIAVFTNGFSAVRKVESIAADSELKLLPGAVKGFKTALAGVKRLWQFFPSYGGSAPESSNDFYVRVSERLRHKQRAVSPQDFCQLILQHFPSIRSVECITAEVWNKYNNDSDIHVVVMPSLTAASAGVRTYPVVGTAKMHEMRKLVNAYKSPFVTVTVDNVVYERIKIACDVRFRQTDVANDEKLVQQLNTDITGFIEPWRTDPEVNINIGGRIYLSAFLNQVKKLPYIESVNFLSVIHFFNEDLPGSVARRYYLRESMIENNDVVEASRPNALIVSAASHFITVGLDHAHVKDYLQSHGAGIGNLAIGKEYLVSSVKQGSVGKLKAPDEMMDFTFNL